VRILFVMLHAGYVRNYDGVLRRLAADGHQIHIAVENNRDKMGENAVARQLVADFKNVTCEPAPAGQKDTWSHGARLLRLFVDYLRYLDRRYHSAAALRERALRVVPKQFQPLMALLQRLGPTPAAAFRRGCVVVDRCIPPPKTVTAFLSGHRPDAVLVTPLVEPGSSQVDYLKAAAARGIPTALCVASWDNLTNKGAMRFVPSRVFVWNEAQREEAVTLHGVPSDRVVVTGAQMFDHWFDWRPSRSREDFCAQVGLDPLRPYILYLGSSFFIAPNEATFGKRWIAGLRGCDDADVARAGILVRPHPSNGQQWRALDLSTVDNIAIWPPAGANMFAPEFKNDFFDSMYYSAAVVGVNTSAQIEAAIVGRVVCTIRAEEFVHSQEGTLHFQHLVKVNGGLLEVADSMEQHAQQLGRILRGESGQAERSRRFVEAFVRPYGLQEPATPRFARELVTLGGTRVGEPAASFALVRAALAWPIVWLVVWWLDRRPLWVYAFRPFFTVVLWVWSVPYHARDLARHGLDGVRRLPGYTRKWTRRVVRDCGRALQMRPLRLVMKARREVPQSRRGAAVFVVSRLVKQARREARHALRRRWRRWSRDLTEQSTNWQRRMVRAARRTRRSCRTAVKRTWAFGRAGAGRVVRTTNRTGVIATHRTRRFVRRQARRARQIMNGKSRPAEPNITQSLHSATMPLETPDRVERAHDEELTST